MEEVGTRRAVLVGHGLGVGIAAAVQAMSPQVAGIVALGLPSLEHPLSSFAADLECSPDRALDGIVNTGLLPVLEGNLTAGVAWRESRRCLLRCLERTTLRADLMVALQARDHLESLQSLAVPWCLMYGQGDAGLSALVRHLVPLVPADWVVSFDTPGASLLLDRGNDVLQTMSQFARECLEQGAPT
jgi:pimeloyl-ACP methyl ester carboxylesterase